MCNVEDVNKIHLLIAMGVLPVLSARYPTPPFPQMAYSLKSFPGAPRGEAKPPVWLAGRRRRGEGELGRTPKGGCSTPHSEMPVAESAKVLSMRLGAGNRPGQGQVASSFCASVS